MLEVILTAAVELIRIAAKLAAGKISEDQARADCIAVGARITEADTDAELAEYTALDGEPD